MHRTLVILPDDNGVDQFHWATLGRDSSLRVSGRVAGEEGGELSRRDESGPRVELLSSTPVMDSSPLSVEV